MIGALWRGLPTWLRYLALLGLALVAILLVSMLVGPCGEPEIVVPDPVEGWVDPGVRLPPSPAEEGQPAPPPAPQVAAGDTGQTRPDLTLAQLQAQAKKYGMDLAPKGALAQYAVEMDRWREEAKRARDQNAPPPPAPPPPYPFPLSEEERFGPGPCGDRIDVSAWAVCDGCAPDLRAAWADYQAPPIEVPAPRFFENVSRWEFEAGPALVAFPGMDPSPGALVGIAFDSIRLGKATLRGHAVALGAYGQAEQLAGFPEPESGLEVGGAVALTLAFGRAR